VSEESSESLAMKDLTSTSFGYVIGFLVAGLLGLFAMSLWSIAIQRVLQPALKAEASVGPSLILLLIALGVGLCISAMRFLVFEKLLCRKHCFPADMFAKLTIENRLTSFKAVVDEHYRYHQFYGGCAVALAILYCGWLRQRWLVIDTSTIMLSIGFVAFEWLMTYAATDAFTRYVERSTTIVRGEQLATAGVHNQR
jgi:hypothetical protein